jgi:hypothetical protein
MTPVTRSLNMHSSESPAQLVISIFMRCPQRGASEPEVNNRGPLRGEWTLQRLRHTRTEIANLAARGRVGELSGAIALLQKPGTLYEVPSIITSLQGHSAAHLGNRAGARIMAENTSKHLAILCVLHKSPYRRDNKNAVSRNL